MKNTHTPAPWQIDYSGNCHIGITDENDRTLAFCSLQNEDGDEDKANARLISAAPNLLAICEEIANDSKCDLVNSERRIRLYSAIAKAKGAL